MGRTLASRLRFRAVTVTALSESVPGPMGRGGTPPKAPPKPTDPNDPGFEQQHPRGRGGLWAKKGAGMNGEPDEQARQLQNRLSALGYAISKDGMFGDQTEQVIREFQTDHGLHPTGVIDDTTTAALKSAQPEHRADAKAAASVAPSTTPATPAADAGQGAAPKPGAYGSAYEDPNSAAVRQQNADLTGDANLDKGGTQNVKGQDINSKGAVIPPKGSKAKGSRSSASSGAGTRARAGSRGAGDVLHKGVGMGTSADKRVKDMQELLDSLGYDLGPAGVDGRFGPDTQKALKQAQRRLGLNPNGIFDQHSRKALDRRVSLLKAEEKVQPGSSLEHATEGDRVSTLASQLEEAVAERQAAKNGAEFTRARAREVALRELLEAEGKPWGKGSDGDKGEGMKRCPSCDWRNAKGTTKCKKCGATLAKKGDAKLPAPKSAQEAMVMLEVALDSEAVLEHLAERAVLYTALDPAGTNGELASVLLGESAKTAALSTTHAPIGKGGTNFITRSKPGNKGQLPAYIQNIRNAIMRDGTDESKATAIAIGRCETWAAGGGNVGPEVKAAAAKAIAEWEKIKASSHLQHAGGGTVVVPDQGAALVEANLRGATDRAVKDIRRLPDGKFAPRGLGQVLTAGERVNVPHKSGEGHVQGIVERGHHGTSVARVKLLNGPDHGKGINVLPHNAPSVRANPDPADVGRSPAELDRVSQAQDRRTGAQRGREWQGDADSGAADGGQQTGRSGAGRLRNFRAMNDQKLRDTIQQVMGENNDTEAMKALHAEAVNRGWSSQGGSAARGSAGTPSRTERPAAPPRPAPSSAQVTPDLTQRLDSAAAAGQRASSAPAAPAAPSGEAAAFRPPAGADFGGLKAGPPADTALTPGSSHHFEGTGGQWGLKAGTYHVESAPQDGPYGKFVQATDPDGNRVNVPLSQIKQHGPARAGAAPRVESYNPATGPSAEQRAANAATMRGTPASATPSRLREPSTPAPSAAAPNRQSGSTEQGRTGRSPAGRLRNYRSMDDAKLSQTIAAVEREGNDPEARTALNAELSRRRTVGAGGAQAPEGHSRSGIAAPSGERNAAGQRTIAHSDKAPKDMTDAELRSALNDFHPKSDQIRAELERRQGSGSSAPAGSDAGQPATKKGIDIAKGDTFVHPTHGPVEVTDTRPAGAHTNLTLKHPDGSTSSHVVHNSARYQASAQGASQTPSRLTEPTRRPGPQAPSTSDVARRSPAPSGGPSGTSASSGGEIARGKKVTIGGEEYTITGKHTPTRWRLRRESDGKQVTKSHAALEKAVGASPGSERGAPVSREQRNAGNGSAATRGFGRTVSADQLPDAVRGLQVGERVELRDGGWVMRKEGGYTGGKSRGHAEVDLGRTPGGAVRQLKDWQERAQTGTERGTVGGERRAREESAARQARAAAPATAGDHKGKSIDIGGKTYKVTGKHTPTRWKLKAEDGSSKTISHQALTEKLGSSGSSGSASTGDSAPVTGIAQMSPASLYAERDAARGRGQKERGDQFAAELQRRGLPTTAPAGGSAASPRRDAGGSASQPTTGAGSAPKFRNLPVGDDTDSGSAFRRVKKRIEVKHGGEVVGELRQVHNYMSEMSGRVQVGMRRDPGLPSEWQFIPAGGTHSPDRSFPQTTGGVNDAKAALATHLQNRSPSGATARPGGIAPPASAASLAARQDRASRPPTTRQSVAAQVPRTGSPTASPAPSRFTNAQKREISDNVQLEAEDGYHRLQDSLSNLQALKARGNAAIAAEGYSGPGVLDEVIARVRRMIERGPQAFENDFEN